MGIVCRGHNIEHCGFAQAVSNEKAAAGGILKQLNSPRLLARLKTQRADAFPLFFSLSIAV